MQDWELKERRTFVRFPVIISSRCWGVDSEREIWCKTCDISSKGVCLVTNEALAKDTSLSICFHMPDNGERIEVKGKVIWHSCLEAHKHKTGFSLENTELKPIPLVLRIMKI